MIEIRELTTGYMIPKKDNYRYYGLENFFSIVNNHTKEREPFGFIEDEKFIRVPKITYDHLGRLLKNTEFSILKLPNTKFIELSKPVTMKNPPKNDIQKEVINNTVKTFKSEESNRVVVSLPTGQGKTYVGTNVLTQLNTPTWIFVKNIKLREQWYASILQHSSMNPQKIACCTGTRDVISILESGINYDVIISTHRTAQVFINEYGMRKFNELLSYQGIGFKIFDEFDLEADSTFKIETHTSVKYTLYLSATDYKSSKYHDKVFQAVYGHLPNFGKEYDIVVKRNAIFFMYDSNPSKKRYYQLQQYTAEGPQFSYHKYHQYIVTDKTYRRGLKLLWEKLIKNRFYSKEEYLKTVFFIGRKTTAEQFRKDIAELFGISAKSIAILNSDTPQSQRASAEKYKLIVSTADSMGRGIDLRGLDIVVDMETRYSKSNTVQVVGRVSRTGMKNVGTYVSFIDTAFPTVLRNHEFKVSSGLYDSLFTNTKTINLDKREE